MPDPSPSDPARYHRQTLLPFVGAEGQRRLAASHALILGLGALGSVAAEALARAGVGHLTLIDRDIVEWSNLQRQTLYDEADARDSLPKAIAARRRLERINSTIRITDLTEDFTPASARRLLAPDVTIILDGTDNFATRYLLNDLAVQRRLPLLYAAAVAATGMVMPILPEGATSAPAGPCLRCLFEDPPAPGSPASAATCDTLGVLGPALATIANLQAIEALKLLLGRPDALNRALLSFDFWTNESHRLDLSNARRDDCPCCALRRFDFLDAPSPHAAASTLCGRNTIQISPPPPPHLQTSRSPEAQGRSPWVPPLPDPTPTSTLDLAALAARLAPHGSFTASRFLLQGEFTSERNHLSHPIRLSLFPDGRALFTGLTDESRARALYARYIGA